MIILLIIVVGLIAGIGLIIFGRRGYHDFAETVGDALTVIFGFLAALSVIMLVILYSAAPAAVEKDKMRYEMLTYQWENGFYENDNEVGKQRLVDQIREWNEDLAVGKRMQNDIWVGAFVPDVFDQYEFIPLDRGQ